jgi:1-acyl-sn-glycerol-3-phosphate acyltransferase
MSHLRATVRAIILCALTCAMFCLLVAGMVVVPFRRARLRWRGLIFKSWAKAAAALIGISLTKHGSPPRAPFFLVSNHLSYVDVLVFASQLDCSFIAKKEVSRWPVIGPLCKGIGTIFIDRESRRDITRVNSQLDRALAEGRSVVLFAEGTSTQGATVLPFKPGLLESAARASFAVSHAAVSYRTRDDETPAHLSVCWWGEMTFMRHLKRLLQMREIRATLTFGQETIQERDRKTLARKLHGAVEQEFIPVIGSEEEWTTAMR